MLAHVVNKDAGGTISPPANWTIIGAQSNTASSRSALFYKFADAADVAASTFTFTVENVGRNLGEMAAWLSVDTTTPVHTADQQINAAGTSIAVPSITVNDARKLLIIGSNAAGGTATACSGINQVCTITDGYAVAYSTYCALACFSGIKATSGAIDAHALSTFTSAVSSGHAVALNPAAYNPNGVSTSKNPYLRSLADKSETGSPNNLRLRSETDKTTAGVTWIPKVIMVM